MCQKKAASLRIPTETLKIIYFRAGLNWLSWQDNFEHGSSARLPALDCPKRFQKFVYDYSLLRSYKTEEREEIRQWLNCYGRLGTATNDPSGAGVDALAGKLKQKGPCWTEEISLVSKLAAFARPDIFIAYDQFATKGAKICIAEIRDAPNKRKSYQHYPAYLADVHEIVKSPVGGQMREYLSTNTPPTKHKKAFVLRMIDCYLMEVGGRND